ncbi:hypothetical protein FC62_GL000141 [Amylolactobacillus amylotrophicus DSM 20534]|uniref:YdhG-like domain-containing protein n=3 Tax=Amylolactobacillus TaxID=2767876 RepID=A0A0R1YSR8_9LACO|nr:hypothetical protein FC62_GL000141 [Amylolactobacillus amylotrophicus DSM 20534]KRM42902.1 hypothetical protein FD40_GL000698 [Amylolactobacillus amylophilus DSM 20533 = JCM 1125]
MKPPPALKFIKSDNLFIISHHKTSVNDSQRRSRLMLERRANAQVDELISKLPEELALIVQQYRLLILESNSAVIEDHKWSMPSYELPESGQKMYIQVAKKYVNLGFTYGVDLLEFDSKRLLTGTGQTMRHIKIVPGRPIDETAVTSLIEHAFN